MKIVTTESTDAQNLTQTLHLLWRKRWHIVLWIAVTEILVALLVFIPLRKYESNLSVMVMNPFDAAPGAAGVSALLGMGDGQNEYVLAILRSQNLWSEVVTRLKLRNSRDFWGGSPLTDSIRRFTTSKEPSEGEALEQMAKLVDIKSEIPPLRGPITVSIRTVSPRLSRDIGEQFLNLLNNRLAINTESRAGFLSAQLNETEFRLNSESRKLREYAEAHKVLPLDVGQQGELELKSLVELQSQLTLARSELRSTEKRLAAPGDLGNRLVLESARLGLMAQVHELEATGLQREERILTFPKIAEEACRIQRAVKTQEKLYEVLLEQYQLAKLKEEGKLETRPFRIVDFPREADEPVKRRGLLKLAIGLMFGLSVGVLQVLALEIYSGWVK